ncbi:MAG TPA: hypothetical protein VGL98_16685 [Gammaproteobacteria bacterium]
MKKNDSAHPLRGFLTLLALVAWLPNAPAQLEIYGNTTTIEDPFMAQVRNRAPRTRAQLAVLIDASVLREALAE